MLKYFFCLLFFITIFFSAQSQTFAQKDGMVTTYSHGKIESKGNVKNHLKTGEWNYWSPGGVLIRTENYFADKHDTISLLQGDYTTYFWNTGTMHVFGHYYKGNKCGEWATFFIAGSSKDVQHYDSLGNPIGKPQIIRNGINNEIQHYDSLGNLIGMQQEFGLDGMPYSWKMINRNGTAVKYTYSMSNGTLYSVGYYTHDTLTGIEKIYTCSPDPSDTIPLQILEYKNGKLNGTSKYYRKGKITAEKHFVNDTLDGEVKRYDKNEKLMSVETYSHGKLNGKDVEYQHGETTVNWYETNLLDSSFNYYSNEKIHIRKKIISKSPRIFLCEEFDSTGNKIKQWKLKNDVLYGQMIYYYPNGKTKAVFNFDESGNWDGVVNVLNENGIAVIKIKQPVHYDNFKEFIINDDEGKLLPQGSHESKSQLGKYLPDYFWIVGKDSADIQINPIYDYYMAASFSEGDMDGMASDFDIDPAPAYYNYSEKQPEFPGGWNVYTDYVLKNLVAQKDSKGKNIQGVIILSFIVEKDGSLSHIEIIQDIKKAPACSSEAIRLFSTMPKWKAGTIDNYNDPKDIKPVRVKMTRAVYFH